MDRKIGLTDLLTALRQELGEAKKVVEQEEPDIRFELGDIEIELKTVVTREVTGEGKVKVRFWVLDGEVGSSGGYSNESTQTLKFTLKPKDVTKPGGSIELNNEE